MIANETAYLCRTASLSPVPSPYPPVSAIRSPGFRRWLPLVVVAIVILTLHIWKPPFVVRPLPSTASGSSTTAGAPIINAVAAFVDPIWDSNIVPAFIERAMDAKELLAAIQTNPHQAGENYGRREATRSTPSAVARWYRFADCRICCNLSVRMALNITQR